MYQAILPSVRKFLCSFQYEVEELKSELTTSILSNTCYKEEEVKKIMQDEIFEGKQHNNKDVFPSEMANSTFFYCATGNAACVCGKKGKSQHHSLQKLSSFKGTKGSFF